MSMIIVYWHICICRRCFGEGFEMNGVVGN